MKKRAEYTVLDFLKDDSFLRSVLLETDEDVAFWEDYILENPEKGQDMETARQLLLSMSFDKEVYSEQEKLELLDQINNEIKAVRKRKIYVGFGKILAAACVVALVSIGIVIHFKPATPASSNLVADETSSLALEKETRLVLAGEKTIAIEEGGDILYENGEMTISSMSQQD